MQPIVQWLEGLGLGQYGPAFVHADIDLSVLPDLTEADLEQLGVTLGHRKKLLRAIAILSEPVSPAPPSTIGAVEPQIRPEAERRQLTVMFCDLVGSTALSALLDPEDLRPLISAFHRCCTEVIQRDGGFIAKYMGDGVLAYFGYPRAHEDDAERAVRAALALVHQLGEVEAPEQLQARIGIATGLVVVGDLLGEGSAQEEAVVGETPNLAARLQALAEPDAIVIAASTRRLLGGLFEYRELGSVALKGFGAPVSAFQVLGPSGVESRFEARQEHGAVPLVGREEELDFLLRRWRQARRGEGQVVLLSAEPGIGKSRLAATLLERLAAEPHVLRYFCSPHRSHSALDPIIRQLEHAAGFVRQDDAATKLGKLQRLLVQSAASEQHIGLIAALLAIPTGERFAVPDVSPQKRKERIFEALLAQFTALAAQRPVLIVYEDVHWLDPTSLELLALAAMRVANLPILLLVTTRPEFKPPWSDEAHATTLALSRLSRPEATALVDRVAGGIALPPELLKQILARTDGVPLFVEELTKSVLESGLLREEAERYTLIGRLPVPAIPATLHDSLMARLDRLAPVRDVVQIGAALGREFSYDLLRAVSGLPETRLQDALRDLVRAELVFCRGVPPHAIYRFKHALVQDAAYGSMLRARRAQLHARIADAIERGFPEVAETEPETLARHYAAAGIAARAIPNWLKAGRRSLQVSGLQEAIGHIRAGIALLGEVRDEATRARFEVDLQAALGFVLTAMKGYASPEVEAAFSRALALSQTMSDLSLRIPILRGLATFHWARGDLPSAKDLTLQLIQIAERTSDHELALVAHSMLGGMLYHMGELSASEFHLSELAEEYDSRTRQNIVARFGEDTLSTLSSYHGYNLAWLGHIEEASNAVRDAVASAVPSRKWWKFRAV